MVHGGSRIIAKKKDRCYNIGIAGTLSPCIDPGWSSSSSSGERLLVPRVNTSTVQRCAFSVVAPSVWNSLPSQIRLLPDCTKELHAFALYKLLKIDLFHPGWTGSESE